MTLNNTITVRFDDMTTSVLEKASNKNDWEISKTVRNFVKSYIEEHNLIQLFTSE